MEKYMDKYAPPRCCTAVIVPACDGARRATLHKNVLYGLTLAMLCLHRYAVPHKAFAPFALTAHQNAATSPEAVFHTKPLTEDKFESSMMITRPVQLMDACPTCDGAAAVVITSNKVLLSTLPMRTRAQVGSPCGVLAAMDIPCIPTHVLQLFPPFLFVSTHGVYTHPHSCINLQRAVAC